MDQLLHRRTFCCRHLGQMAVETINDVQFRSCPACESGHINSDNQLYAVQMNTKGHQKGVQINVQTNLGQAPGRLDSNPVSLGSNYLTIGRSRFIYE